MLVNPPITDPLVEYFTISPLIKSWFKILIWLIEVLISDILLETVLLLFSYPNPEFSIFTDPSTDFLLNDLSEWFPTPKEVNWTVLIPETASFNVLWSFSCVGDWTEIWYEASVERPPTPLWLSVV